MANKEAIKIIQIERDHCATHNRDAGMSEDYHKEMQSLVDAYDLAIKALEERPQGEWLKSDVPESVLAKCSICGFDCGAYTHNFCPNCGADMRGEEG